MTGREESGVSDERACDFDYHSLDVLIPDLRAMDSVVADNAADKLAAQAAEIESLRARLAARGTLTSEAGEVLRDLYELGDLGYTSATDGARLIEQLAADNADMKASLAAAEADAERLAAIAQIVVTQERAITGQVEIEAAEALAAHRTRLESQ